MADQNSRANRSGGYVQAAAGAIDSSTLVSNLFPGGVLPDGTVELRLICETQAIRWRDDGTAPTATVGMLLPVATTFVYTSSLNNLRVISATAGAVLNVTAYRAGV